MRALFSCIPGFGHFHPLVPLAKAMEGAGHQVAFATAERFCRGVVEPAGFRAFGAGLSPPEVEERMAGRREAEPLDGDPAETAARMGAFMFAGVAGPAKVADLTRVIGEWEPDVVVHDAIDFGAPVAAAGGGRPWVSHGFGALSPSRLWELSALAMGPTWREWGMEPAADGGIFRYLYLDICPPCLQAPHIEAVSVARPMRPVPFDTPRGERLARWVSELSPAPTVYVTLGTVFNHAPGLFEAVLEGLRDEPVNVIVTVGPNRDPSELGEQPENVHVERYLPQSLLFPHCDLVVAHGGAGTTLSALAYGLPMLFLPQGANQDWYARRCTSLGAGAALYPGEVTAAAVRSAARELLGQAEYRAAAGRIQQEIAGMPGPQEAVGLVEELARRRQPMSQ